MKNKNIPEVRFLGFTEDWMQLKFIDTLDENDGIRRGPFGSALKKDLFVASSDYVVYEQKNAIYDNFATRYNITQEKFEELKNFQLNEGDFILSGAGTIGRISRVPKNIKPGVFNQALIRFKINENVTDSEYFIQWIRSEKMQRKITGANPGSAISNLVPMSEVKNWDIVIPTRSEQARIGIFFKKIDDVINLHQQELTTLKQTKQGFLQKMFPKEGASIPEIRFKGFIGDWDEQMLGKGLKINSGRDYKHLKKGNIPVYGTGGYMLSVNDKLSDEDAIGIGRKGTINKPQLLKAPFWTVDTLFFMTTQEKNDLYFCYTLANKINWKKYDESTGVPSLSKASIEKIPVSVPPYEEQIKIGKFFGELDEVIALQQQELDALKQTKKAFQQKMFV